MTGGDPEHPANPAESAKETGAGAKDVKPGGSKKVGSASSKGSPSDALGSLESDFVKAVQASQKDTSDPLVMAAFVLGWRMAELFKPLPPPANEIDDGDLPGLSSLARRDRELIRVKEIEVGIQKLTTAITAVGQTAPDAEPLQQAVGTPGLRDKVKTLHHSLLTTLTAVDSRYGTSYGLGRALRDTCFKPTSLTELADQFNKYRIANLRGWLDELSSAFPAHASHSVEASLVKWTTWSAQAASPQAASSGETGRMVSLIVNRARAARPEDLSENDVLARARRQGELWHAVLSGEKRPQELLELDNYVDAASEAGKRMASAARKALWRFKLAVLATIVLIGLGIWLVTSGGAAKDVAGATSFLAAVGLSWKGLGGALGKLAAQLEEPVWGAIVDQAVTNAITLLPTNAKEKGGRQDVAIQIAISHRQQQQVATSSSSDSNRD
jgi:hypothetical protein